MISRRIYDKYMPISKQHIYIKGYVWLTIFWRMFIALLKDNIRKPDAIIITRRIVPRFMPRLFSWLINRVSKSVPIIWDYDDEIICSKEVSRKTFNLYARISSVIFCTSEFLKDLVLESYKDKVVLLPTTDGDMYEYNNPSLKEKRQGTLKDTVKLVWVATSVNLPHILRIAPVLDDAAKRIKKESGRDLQLEVICNDNLVYDFKYLKLINTKWTREDAIKGMLNAHIGIMPLSDNQFTRGKGGFKLVQYLSIGLPCIGSNVGFNAQVISSGSGFLVNTDSEWIDAILKLSNPAEWPIFSEGAFNQWSVNFSFDKNLSKWRYTLTNLG